MRQRLPYVEIAPVIRLRAARMGNIDVNITKSKIVSRPLGRGAAIPEGDLIELNLFGGCTTVNHAPDASITYRQTLAPPYCRSGGIPELVFGGGVRRESAMRKKKGNK
jgi:hypothetical protein